VAGRRNDLHRAAIYAVAISTAASGVVVSVRMDETHPPVRHRMRERTSFAGLSVCSASAIGILSRDGG
jgi:hypothetical protein